MWVKYSLLLCLHTRKLLLSHQSISIYLVIRITCIHTKSSRYGSTHVHRDTVSVMPHGCQLKVPLTPPNFFLLKKSNSFPDFISEKIISIDKILAFLQVFEHVTSMFTTVQSGIWVGLLVTSLREPSWNTQETFDWA